MLGEQLESANIVVTDENDIKVEIFNSDVFERFEAEYCADDKIIAIENSTLRSIRDLLIASAAAIGTLRFLSKREGWNASFNGMRICYTKSKSFDIDIKKQLQLLRARSTGSSIPVANDDVEEAIKEALAGFPKLISHVCGHDLCEIISKGVHEIFGRSDIGLRKCGFAIEEVFRTAYTFNNFKMSSIFQKISEWQSRTVPYIVLAGEPHKDSNLALMG